MRTGRWIGLWAAFVSAAAAGFVALASMLRPDWIAAVVGAAYGLLVCAGGIGLAALLRGGRPWR